MKAIDDDDKNNVYHRTRPVRASEFGWARNGATLDAVDSLLELPQEP